MAKTKRDEKEKRVHIFSPFPKGLLGEHECSTNWGDYNSTEIRINQIKCWFLRQGENRSTRGKTSWSRVEKQQTQPKYGIKSRN